MEPRTDGSIDFSDAKSGILKKLTTLAKSKGVKVHLCVGGWGKSKHFSKMAANPVSRLAFVRNLTAFLQKHQLDGADVDWEHPKSKAEIEDFQKLLIDLKTGFRPHGFELSIAVAGWGTYLEPETIPFVDLILVMAYDQGTPHSSFSGAKSDMEHWVKQGVPKSKLVLGLPFYGRNDKKNAMTYDEIVRRFKPSSDSDLAGGYHFNGPATIRKKTAHAARGIWWTHDLGTRAGCEGSTLPVACRAKGSKNAKPARKKVTLSLFFDLVVVEKTVVQSESFQFERSPVDGP